MPAPSKLDWVSIEKEWKAGVLSNAAIAARYGATESNVCNTAKRKRWVKDFAAGLGVVMLAHEKAERPEPPPKPEPEPIDLSDTIEELSDLGADIVRTHRKDIARLRGVVKEMAKELVDQVQNRPEIEDRLMEYFSAKAALDPMGAMVYKNQLSMALRTLGLGSRAKTATLLVQSMDRLVAMERQSFRLDTETSEKTYEQHLKEIHDKAMLTNQTGENRVN